MKIKLSKEKLEKELKISDENTEIKQEETKKTEEKTKKEKRSFFDIFSTILIIILLVGVVIEIVVIISLNSRINKLNDQIANLPQVECVYEAPEIEVLGIKQIENSKKIVLI